MSARTQPANITYTAYAQYNSATIKLLEASRSGDAFTVYSDYAIWDSTLNTYVDPNQVQNIATGRIGLGAFAGN